jgi:hypothetical protein
MTISGPDVAQAIASQVRQYIEGLDGFDAAWAREYENQRETFADQKNGEVETLEKELAAAQKKLANHFDALDKMHSCWSCTIKSSSPGRLWNLVPICLRWKRYNRLATEFSRLLPLILWSLLTQCEMRSLTVLYCLIDLPMVETFSPD